MKETLFIFLVACSITAHGATNRGKGSGFFMEETFVPVFVNNNDTTSFNTAPGVAVRSGTGSDLRTTLGSIFADQFIVGFTYNAYNLTTQRPAVEGGDSSERETTQRSEYGPTLGYTRNGWRLLLTSFLSGSKQVDRKNVDSTGTTTGDVTFKNTRLSGYQISLGYTFALGNYFEIGPSLVYKTLTYAHQSKTNRLNPVEDYGDSALYSKHVDDSLSPMITLLLRF